MNNWITKRCQQTGTSIGGRSGKHKGPLREVSEVYKFVDGIFDTDSVLFICGHKGRRSCGAIKGRCAECGKKEAQK